MASKQEYAELIANRYDPSVWAALPPSLTHIERCWSMAVALWATWEAADLVYDGWLLSGVMLVLGGLWMVPVVRRSLGTMMSRRWTRGRAAAGFGLSILLSIIFCTA